MKLDLHTNTPATSFFTPSVPSSPAQDIPKSRLDLFRDAKQLERYTTGGKVPRTLMDRLYSGFDGISQQLLPEDIYDPAHILSVHPEEDIYRFNASDINLTYEDAKLESAYFLNQIFCDTLDDTVEHFGTIFPEHLGQILSRPKSVSSILSKLSDRKKKFRERIDHLLDTPYDDRVRDELLQIASKIVYDGLGVKIILDQPDKKGMDDFVNHLCHAILCRKLKVSKIKNYHGFDSIPYLTKKQIQKIINISRFIAGKSYYPIEVISERSDIPEKSAIKKVGYTSAQFELEMPNGLQVDLHVRGDLIDNLSKAETFYYQATDLDRKLHYFPNHVQGLIRKIRQLTPAQKLLYERYLQQSYAQARDLELGIMTDEPEFPANQLPRFLELNSLLNIIEND